MVVEAVHRGMEGLFIEEGISSRGGDVLAITISIFFVGANLD